MNNTNGETVQKNPRATAGLEVDRETELARVARGLIYAWREGEEVDTWVDAAQAALKIKAKPKSRRVVDGRPRIVIDVRGGVAEINADESTGDYSCVLRDWDNCPACGGVKCGNGHNAEAVHGRAHRKVMTGKCPVCKHYGDDCTGEIAG